MKHPHRDDAAPCRPGWNTAWRRLCWLLVVGVAFGAVATPGCSCRQETPAERAAREKREEEEAEKRRQEAEAKKKKPPLEIQPPIPQPGPDDIVSLFVKPGHWMVAKQAMTPNYENWVGEATLQVVDTNNQPIAVERTEFAVRSSRDVALVKGQEKVIESVFYVPQAEGKLNSRSTVRERGAALVQPPENLSLRRMQPHQQHFVVLGKEPQRYRFLTSLRCVDALMPPEFELTAKNFAMPFTRQYRVVTLSAAERVLLPDNPLCWTSVAYLLWDEVDPDSLSQPQQQAIIDWLHWGGQLLISGPDSMDLLRDSFLDPYLPAESLGARSLTAADLKPLSDAWSTSRKPLPLRPAGEWTGIRLKLRPDAEPLAGVERLMAERRVGQGRVIVSAMQLAERDLINWEHGFESLFNGLVLRRPPRSFGENPNAGYDRSGETRRDVFVRRPGAVDDAGWNSRLRFFSRDTYASTTPYAFRLMKAADDFDSASIVAAEASAGPAAWSDFNAVAGSARDTLRQAAGVNVPDSGFVMMCLGTYLAVLVPFNWFFFKALGRVELAWAAAPLIALAGTWVVVRQAQLDIGFVRAQTEVAILETQPEHSRGHLTRYLSFYTSLSTTYDLEFDDPTAVAAPFARGGRGDEPPLRRGQMPKLVGYQRLEKARLLGLSVSSNATDHAHVEQMVDLGKMLRWDPDRRRLTNESDLAIESLAVVSRPKKGDSYETPLLGGWVGRLDPRSSATVALSPITPAEGAAVFAEQRLASAGDGDASEDERLSFEPLFALALDPKRLEPGEVRAVGRLRKVLPGVTVTPAASQLRGDTLLVAHLQYGPLPAPKRDANAPIDVMPSR
ncbi:MAG: hypothetical protein AAGJ46_04865 [Planctomycetota bacterium]